MTGQIRLNIYPAYINFVHYSNNENCLGFDLSFTRLGLVGSSGLFLTLKVVVCFLVPSFTLGFFLGETRILLTINPPLRSPTHIGHSSI